MGLLLVEQRVQDAGGTLQVTSTVGRGTKVVMRLPLAGPGVSGPLAR
jgi:signal transduction histidine kinase